MTFTATLPAHATGQVTFMDGAVALGTATVLDETASFSTSQLSIANALDHGGVWRRYELQRSHVGGAHAGGKQDDPPGGRQ